VKEETRNSMTGMVASRSCPQCGHHEVGFVTEDGAFHPLRPGTLIQISEPPSSFEADEKGPETLLQMDETEQIAYRIWVPEPLRGDKLLRLKYSVMVKEHLFNCKMSGGLYELAYLEKLESLIEKVLDIPLPVILDRFFTAPYLASGNPWQIAEAMYRELDEIKRPVVLMRNWLERGDAESLEELIKPKSIRDLGQEPAEDAQVGKELNELHLEEFIQML
jgi:hypothetical protein